jgi:hypothetical protein
VTTRIVTLDCEFVPNRLDPDGLVAIGMTDGTNHFYGINADMDIFAVLAWKRPWMVDNVVRHFPVASNGRLNTDHADVYSYAALRTNVEAFFAIGGDRDDQILYMRSGAQDMLRVHTLWDNDWSEMPDCIPHDFEDIKHVIRRSGVDKTTLPQIDPDKAHHAFHDAEHEMVLLKHLGIVA